MQPVLEIRKIGENSYTYAVRAPRASGEPPPLACYVDLGFTSFAACLRDAAQALTYFARVYIRYQGLCVGEETVARLERHPQVVAHELLADYMSKTETAAAP